LKVAKEDIIGMVAAVDWFLSQDDAAMEAEFRKRADRIAEQVKKVPTVETTSLSPPSRTMFRTCS
jgi:L-seryl-tRNA(Ser) seleniumtransferase